MKNSKRNRSVSFSGARRTNPASLSEAVNPACVGGTLAFANGINSLGQVAGASSLADDMTFHAFLRDKGKLTDFGTLGGLIVEAIGLNEAGEVVGKADLPGSLTFYAFVATNGAMTDLGTQDGDPCSDAISINEKNQIVGLVGSGKGATLRRFDLSVALRFL